VTTLLRHVALSPDVRLQHVSSFHRRYSIDKGLTFGNLISVRRISSETAPDRAQCPIGYLPFLSGAPRRSLGLYRSALALVLKVERREFVAPKRSGAVRSTDS
jgi:hypothetical protein